ncbi:MAG: hypothetical protein ACK5MK_00960 [Dysgonomonas sp.]
MNRFKYSINYYFDGDNISIIEIKRHLLNEENKSKIFHWLMHDKKNGCLNPLTFVSASSQNDNTEFRQFEEGTLELNHTSAVYSDGKEKISLKAIPQATPLSEDLAEMIGDYLLMLSF